MSDETFHMKENDTAPPITRTLTDVDDAALDITGGTVEFHMAPIDDRASLTVDATATIVSAGDGTVEYDWSAGDTTTPGTYVAEFELTHSDGSVESFPKTGDITVVVHPEVG